MALVNRLSNNYDGTDGFAEGIRNLGEILAQGPAIRARAAQMQAERQRIGAMTDEASAHANLYQNQAEREQLATAGLKQIGDLANQGLLRTDSEGNLIVDSSLASKLVGGILQQSKGASDAGGGLAKALAGMNAPVQADLNRQNKQDVTAAVDTTKENIAEAGDQTKLSIADKNVAGRLAVAATPKPPPSGSAAQDLQLARLLADTVAARNKSSTNSIPNVVDQYESGLKYARTNAPAADPLLQDNSIKPAAAPVGQQNEVIRMTKDGKKAIFDANTKQFLRYAD